MSEGSVVKTSHWLSKRKVDMLREIYTTMPLRRENFKTIHIGQNTLMCYPMSVVLKSKL